MIDLHTHTTASDGEFTPSELIDLAINKNIKVLSITDHDTIDGLKAAVEYVKNKDILFIPGIELKAQCKSGQMHILGYNIDYTNLNLQEKLNDLVNKRNIRNAKYIEYFRSLGFDISLEELQEISGGLVIGKPHFAKLFLQKGYITNKDIIYSGYFNCEPLSKIRELAYEPEEVIRIVKEASGTAILAHPQTLKLSDNDLEDKLKELMDYGLDGLECYHSNQTLEEMQKFRELALKYKLLITKGSDYHGPAVKPNIRLGTGIDNNIVNNEEEIIISRLLKKRK